MQRSILGQLLPEAMVNYLENHGAEKFAQIFLGEFDTPEAIWNAEMRQVTIRIKFVVIITVRSSCLVMSISESVHVFTAWPTHFTSFSGLMFIVSRLGVVDFVVAHTFSFCLYIIFGLLLVAPFLFIWVNG